MGFGILGDCMKPTTLEAIQAQMISFQQEQSRIMERQRLLIDQQKLIIEMMELYLDVIFPKHVYGKKIE